MRRLLRAAALHASLAACSAAPVVGSQLTIAGTLVLKGNAPRPVPVLVRSATEQWELQDLPAATAVSLQNRHVEVTGTVTRPPGSRILLPALRVTRLH